MTTLHLDGNSLNLEDLVKLSAGGVQIALTEDAWGRVRKAREHVDAVLRSGQIVYGINTGFGNFSQVRVAPDQLVALQENLIRSHAAGVGPDLSLEEVRSLFALRINVLAKGFSGISEQTLRQLIAAFNADCLSRIPSQGTLGASGDLAPLSHLALGLLGDGDMWNPASRAFEPARGAKEGLALINGTQFMTAIGALALARARNVAEAADYITALSTEALRGVPAAFRPEIHAARGHAGQVRAAAHIGSLLHSQRFPSEIASAPNKVRVQDAYSLRCAPQVHGVVHDTVDFVTRTIETEMNAATDNPMVFDSGEIVSGGNFHGEYPAKVLDYLGIAVHELGNISECRTERLLNNHLSELPSFLVREGGLNSGFMIAQCTAAALVSESKALCHPSSVDSIPTSEQQEDHVAMGGWAARKAARIVGNVELTLAVELLCACQALDFLAPLRPTAPLAALHALVRRHVAHWERDRYMKPDIDAAAHLIRSGAVVECIRSALQTSE